MVETDKTVAERPPKIDYSCAATIMQLKHNVKENKQNQWVETNQTIKCSIFNVSYLWIETNWIVDSLKKNLSSMDHRYLRLLPLLLYACNYVSIGLSSKLLALVAELRRTGKREQTCSKVERGH